MSGQAETGPDTCVDVAVLTWSGDQRLYVRTWDELVKALSRSLGPTTVDVRRMTEEEYRAIPATNWAYALTK